jgi:hypothetical protein
VSRWQRAAECYRQAGAIADAARCYERGGYLRMAADLHLTLDAPVTAAGLFERAGDVAQAAWVLAHVVGETEEARACLARNPVPEGAAADDAQAVVPRLLCLLAATRCDIAAGRQATAAIGALTEVQRALASELPVNDARVREWAIEIAILLDRLDQVALVYAASVRGRRPRAAALWTEWVANRYGTPLVLPGVPATAGRAADG